MSRHPDDVAGPDEARERPSRRLSLRRAAPLIALALGALAAWWAFGDRLSFEALARRGDAIAAWRADNPLLAPLAFMGVYVAAVAFSLPGAVWLSIIGGALFGPVAGTFYIVAAATIGATAIFLAAKTGLGDALRARSEGWIARLEKRFQENEASFMLALRLVPAVPFFVANLAPAFLGVRLVTFVWTTFVGIIPGAAVFASLGDGVGETLAMGERPDLGVIFEWRILGPLLGLAALSLLPALVRRRREDV